MLNVPFTGLTPVAYSLAVRALCSASPTSNFPSAMQESVIVQSISNEFRGCVPIFLISIMLGGVRNSYKEPEAEQSGHSNPARCSDSPGTIPGIPVLLYR